MGIVKSQEPHKASLIGNSDEHLSYADIIRSFLDQGAVLISTGRLSLDSEVTFGFGASQRTIARTDEHLCVFAPDFRLNEETPWFNFSDYLSCSVGNLLEGLTGCLPDAALTTIDLGASFISPKREYERDFFEVKAQIQSQELVKAVPIARKTFEKYPNWVQKGHILRNLLLKILDWHLNDPSQMPQSLYCLWSEEEGMIGLTPELLFELDSSKLKTMALAGTRVRGDARRSLLEDSKEVSEHGIVVEGILSRLDGIGNEKIGTTHEVNLPHLIHLCTELEIRFNEPPIFEELIARLHPTPALGAWPAEICQTWLQTYRGNSLRGRHGAPFSIAVPGSNVQTAIVAIRNLQWTQNGSQITAGAGIVEKSKLDSEWLEIQAKMRSAESLLLK